MRRLLWLGLMAVPAWAQMPQTPADSAKIWYSIGKDYLLKKRYDDAIRNFQRALSYNDTFALVYLDLAQAFLGKAQEIYAQKQNEEWKAYVDSARVVYETMTRKLPEDSRAYQGLGYLYGVVLKEQEKGLEYYRKAVALDSTNTAAAFGLAKLMAQMGRAGEADSLFRFILRRDTANAAYRGAYGMFLVDQKRYEEAFSYLEEALEAYPENADLLTNFVDAALAINKEQVQNRTVLQKALIYVSRLLEKSPRDPGLYLKRSQIYEKLGNVEKALSDLDQVLALSPGYVPAMLKKAALLVDTKRYDKAERVLSEILAMDEVQKNPQYRASALSLRGYVYYVWGDNHYKARSWADAEEHFRKAKEFYQACAGLSTPYAASCAEGVKKAENMEKKAYRKKVGIE